MLPSEIIYLPSMLCYCHLADGIIVVVVAVAFVADAGRPSVCAWK